MYPASGKEDTFHRVFFDLFNCRSMNCRFIELRFNGLRINELQINILQIKGRVPVPDLYPVMRRMSFVPSVLSHFSRIL